MGSQKTNTSCHNLCKFFSSPTRYREKVAILFTPAQASSGCSDRSLCWPKLDSWSCLMGLYFNLNEHQIWEGQDRRFSKYLKWWEWVIATPWSKLKSSICSSLWQPLSWKHKSYSNWICHLSHKASPNKSYDAKIDFSNFEYLRINFIYYYILLIVKMARPKQGARKP
jgi:hypothetical protein